MANRHSHKKLRSDVRRRMAATGESYQTALNRIHVSAQRAKSGVDLIAASYFGMPIVLATFEAREPVGRPVITHVPSSRTSSVGAPPAPPPFLMLRPGGVQ